MMSAFRPVSYMATAFVAIASSTAAPPHAQNSRSASSSAAALAGRHARFIAAVKPRATLIQVRQALPAGCRLLRRGWHSPDIGPSGIFYDIRGTITGSVALCDPARMGFGAENQRASDPINVVELDVPGAILNSHSLGAKYIQVVSKRFGRPKTQSWVDSHWEAQWDLRGGKHLHLSPGLLSLTFSYGVYASE